MTNPYETGLDKNAANYLPLTPITFLERTAKVFPDQLAIVHELAHRVQSLGDFGDPICHCQLSSTILPKWLHR